MKALMTSIAAICLCGLALAQQPNPPAKPGPEFQKMSVWQGDWTYEAVVHSTPLGPGGKFTGKMTGRPALNGFAFDCVYEETRPTGVAHALERCWYDPAAKKYAYVYLSDDGYLEQGPFVMTADGDTWEANCVDSGRPFRMRGVETVARDGMLLTRKAEMSVDGKTWLPYIEQVVTKAKAALARTAKAGAKPVLLVARDNSSVLDLMLTKEVGVMVSMLERAGYKVVVASMSGQPLVGSATTLRPDLKLAAVNVDDYAGFLLPCMAPPEGQEFPAPRELVQFARKAVSTGKPVAAQMSAVGTLFDAGVMTGRQFAAVDRADVRPYFKEAVWKGEGVVQDGNILTSGICPNMTKEMGKQDGTAALTQKFIDALASAESAWAAVKSLE